MIIYEALLSGPFAQMKSFPHDSKLITWINVMLLPASSTTHSTKTAHLNPAGTENTEQLHKLQTVSRFHIAYCILGLNRPASIQHLIKKKIKKKTINGIFLAFFTRFFWAALMWVCCFGHTSPKQVELHLPRPADDRRHHRCENRPLIQCAISLMDNLSAERWWIWLQYFIPAFILFVCTAGACLLL